MSEKESVEEKVRVYLYSYLFESYFFCLVYV